MKTLHFTLIWFLTRGVAYGVQRWDRGRLTPEARERAWNSASWGAAVYNFGHLSMLGWCWVSRAHWPWWKRIGLGLLSFVVLELVLDGADWAIGAATGTPDLFQIK